MPDYFVKPVRPLGRSAYDYGNTRLRPNPAEYGGRLRYVVGLTLGCAAGVWLLAIMVA